MNSPKTCRVPESPRYYIAMGKYKKAFSVLSYMRSCSCRKDKRKRTEEEDNKDLELLLASQRDEQQAVTDMDRQKKMAATSKRDGVVTTSRRGSKLASTFKRCFPRELWTVPRLSYTRFR